MPQPRVASVFPCHGGGAWAGMNGSFRETLTGLERSLQAVPAQWPQRPEAILMPSAHRDEAVFTVTAAEQPRMIGDDAVFPPKTCAIRDPSPGSPALAHRVAALLREAGLAAQTSLTRGWSSATSRSAPTDGWRLRCT